MKKLLLTFVLVLVATVGFAQNDNSNGGLGEMEVANKEGFLEFKLPIKLPLLEEASIEAKEYFGAKSQEIIKAEIKERAMSNSSRFTKIMVNSEGYLMLCYANNNDFVSVKDVKKYLSKLEGDDMMIHFMFNKVPGFDNDHIIYGTPQFLKTIHAVEKLLASFYKKHKGKVIIAFSQDSYCHDDWYDYEIPAPPSNGPIVTY